MSQSTSFWEGEHPSETTLRQFLNGNLTSEATLAVEGHIAVCEQCRSRLDHIINDGNVADTFLVELTQAFAGEGLAPPVPRLALTEQRYSDFETIAAYVDGTLSPENVKELEALMRQSPQLAQQVAELRAFKEDLHLQTSPDLARTPNVIERETRAPIGVKRQSAASPTKTRKTWRRWLVPSLGLATATALLLFLALNPLQQKPQNKQGQSTPAPMTSTEAPPPNEETKNVTRGGGSEDDTPPKQYSAQTRLLALANPQRESQALLHLVNIHLYKVSGRYNSNGTRPSSPPSNLRTPLALSQRWDVNVGDDIQFHFENQAEQILYLALFWLAQDGSITPVTPPRPHDSVVIKLQPQRTSGSQVSTLDYEIQPLTGLEKIKIFVSTRPINLGYLNFDDARESTSEAAKPLSSLDVMIGEALGKRPLPKSSIQMDSKSWTTTTHEIHISKK
ncbi:hypothetical protein IAD21_06424 (plasmid) [Abditibacteriota bacterium]|nr:hypothetical protein IAD21_06424 [Abditibacteriota bacterium]